MARLEEALQAVGVGPYQYGVCLLAGLAVSADGVEKAATMYIIQRTSQRWGLHGEVLGLLGAASGLGQAVGSYGFGLYSDISGRRTALVASLLLCLVMGIACAFSPNYAVFVWLRFLANLGLGGALPVAFTLVAEFLPSLEREKWVPFLYAFFGVGRLTTAFLAWLMQGSSWRFYMIVLALPCGLVLVLKNWLPESPQYLLVKRQTWQAQHILERMASVNGATLPVDFRAEMLEVEDQQKKQGNWLDVFHSRQAVILCLVWLLVALGSEWGNWVPKFLKSSGVSSSTASVGLIFFNANELVVPLAVALLNRSGLLDRGVVSPLIIISATALASLLLLILVAGQVGHVQLVMFCVLTSYCAISVWVYLYFMTPSYFATEIRGTAVGVCMMFSRIGFVIAPLLAAGIADIAFTELLKYCAGCFLLMVLLSTCLRHVGECNCEDGEKMHLKQSF